MIPSMWWKMWIADAATALISLGMMASLAGVAATVSPCPDPEPGMEIASATTKVYYYSSDGASVTFDQVQSNFDSVCPVAGTVPARWETTEELDAIAELTASQGEVLTVQMTDCAPLLCLLG